MKAPLSEKQIEVFDLVKTKLGKENVFLVGGSVRDALLGKENLDMDFAVRNDPKSVFAAFPYARYFEKYGTVSFRLDKVRVTIATFRRERSYLDHRHPSQVLFVKSLYEDYKRRDFTCNAIYMDGSLDVKDPTKHGVRDIKKGLLRVVGNPYRKLSEDPLRILRAYRFRLETGFRFTRRLEKAILETKDLIWRLNPDKVREELTKFPAEKRSDIVEELGLMSFLERKEADKAYNSATGGE